MNCVRAEELLPWLLNGSLEAAEAGSVRAHLAGCAACRTAWVDTSWVVELSASHVPAGNLVDLAAGVALTGGDRAAVEAHLAGCMDCAAEMALLRASWTAHAAPERSAKLRSVARSEPGNLGDALTARPRTTWSWRDLALAAAVAGMILGSLGFWQMRLGAARDRLRWAAEVERWSAETEEARRDRATAEARLVELEAPVLNARVAELMPQDLVLRSALAPLPVLTVPAAGRITLLLYAPPTGLAEEDYGVELRDAQGVVRWSARGLTRQPTGDFSLSLPATLLAEGSAEIRVLASGRGQAVVARYGFQVRLGSRK